jgi:hypothetical protein
MENLLLFHIFHNFQDNFRLLTVKRKLEKKKQDFMTFHDFLTKLFELFLRMKMNGEVRRRR